MFWAITSYFNPVRYRSRLANYRRFRAALNVPLVAVEAAADGQFELGPGDAEVLVQRSGDSGSPGAVGSTNASKSRRSVGSVTVARLRPPPARRLRAGGSG